MFDPCLRRKFSLRGCHTDFYGLGKRRSISVRFGGLVQLITRGSIILVHPVTNEDSRALGQYALQAPHEIADMSRTRIQAQLRQADQLGIGAGK